MRSIQPTICAFSALDACAFVRPVILLASIVTHSGLGSPMQSPPVSAAVHGIGREPGDRPSYLVAAGLVGDVGLNHDRAAKCTSERGGPILRLPGPWCPPGMRPLGTGCPVTLWPSLPGKVRLCGPPPGRQPGGRPFGAFENGFCW